MNDMKQVWACGGGTQSCAIAVLIIQGKLPKPDLSIIADTGREKAKTWAYYDAHLAPELAKVGVTLHRVKATEWGWPSSGNNLVNSKGTLLIPAFTDESGSIGKLTNYCSTYWKQDVRRRFTSAQGIMPRETCCWLGYSYDEPKRWIRKKESAAYLKGQLRFPLVDDFPCQREQAIQLVLDYGWPTPPRSACWMCPNMRDEEWIELRDESPEEFEEAIALDLQVRTLDPNAFLHRSGKPLSEVQFRVNHGELAACDSGHCFV